MSLLDDWIAKAQQDRGSDVHIVAGLPVRVRIDGRLTDLTDYPSRFSFFITTAKYPGRE